MSPFEEYYSIFQGIDDRYLVDPLSPRNDLIDRIKKTPHFDIVVIGGGIHGASFARIAALNGLATLLLERDDYAQATSSKSSKMAHGGLRYLEKLDLRQVYEGLRAREDLFHTAPHLVTPAEFIVPIKDTGTRFKIDLGLSLYDLLSKYSHGRHKWFSRSELEKKFPSLLFALGETYKGAFQYIDGVMNDTRLVIENVLAARQEGAYCLNYSNVEAIIRKGVDSIVVWQDILTGERHRTECGLVVNCAGPWVPFAGRVSASEIRSLVCYSQGSHLVFDKKWNGPSVVFPMESKGRYYFIWPYGDSTIVGTTERELDTPPIDPVPHEDEVEEILARLSKDLPSSGLSRSNLSYAYAGVRTLPKRGAKKDVSDLSRRHIWHYANGILSLIGGKFTTAYWTAFEGLVKAFELSGVNRKPSPLTGRMLPGGFKFQEVTTKFLEFTEKEGISKSVALSAIKRLGSRVRYLSEYPSGLDVIGNSVFKGEIDIAINIEQGVKVEDILARRLCLELTGDHGFSLISYLRDKCSGDSDYESKVNKIRKIVKA